MMYFDEWNDSILSNCGHYYSTPTKSRDLPIGNFQIEQRHGVEIAHLSCRIDKLERTREGIRRDENEFLFLLLQLEGTTGVIHNGRQELLSPGDGLLLDSTRTARLCYEGKDSSFLSVHLPRDLCFEGRDQSLAYGHRVPGANPLHASLKKLLLDAPEEAIGVTPDFLLDYVALMFRDQVPTRDAGLFRDGNGRYRFVRDMVERHMQDPNFTIEKLAGLVHMSRRQLQRDFQSNGTTFSRHLVERRLKRVAVGLRRAADENRNPRISELAFDAGFSDLSYFNREFRKRYDMSPRGYLANEQNT